MFLFTTLTSVEFRKRNSGNYETSCYTFSIVDKSNVLEQQQYTAIRF